MSMAREGLYFSPTPVRAGAITRHVTCDDPVANQLNMLGTPDSTRGVRLGHPYFGTPQSAERGQSVPNSTDRHEVRNRFFKPLSFPNL